MIRQYDELLFQPGETAAVTRSPTNLTRRNILSVVAAIYDPLGFFMPFTLRGMRILQKSVSAESGWNTPVDDAIGAEFPQRIGELDVMREHRLPRRYAKSFEKPQAYYLHVFGDASPIAYATVAIIESRFANDTSETASVMCKSRLASRQPQTIPRLELLAAVLAVELKTFLVDRMDVVFEKTFLYTDSMITYHWVTAASPGRWRPFVANRVLEIQRLSFPDEWLFVPEGSNRAAMATRGLPARALATADTWWSGPAWLRLPAGEHPTSKPGADAAVLDPVQTEARAVVAPVCQCAPVIDRGKFSSAHRAVRVLALVLRVAFIARREELPLAREL